MRGALRDLLRIIWGEPRALQAAPPPPPPPPPLPPSPPALPVARPPASHVAPLLPAPLAGTRLVAVALSAFVCPLPMLPLVPHLALQAVVIATVRRNSSLCSTALLTHPLTVARIRSVHAVMRLLVLVLPGGWAGSSPVRLITGACMGCAGAPLCVGCVGCASAPQPQHTTARCHAGAAGPNLARRAVSQEAECESFLSFLSVLVGLLLPLCLIVRTEPAASLRRWENSWAAGTAGRLSSLEYCMRLLCGRSWLADSGGQGGDAEAAAPTAAGASHRHGSRQLKAWERGLLWWQLLGLCWYVAMALEHA